MLLLPLALAPFLSHSANKLSSVFTGHARAHKKRFPLGHVRLHEPTEKCTDLLLLVQLPLPLLLTVCPLACSPPLRVEQSNQTDTHFLPRTHRQTEQSVDCVQRMHGFAKNRQTNKTCARSSIEFPSQLKVNSTLAVMRAFAVGLSDDGCSFTVTESAVCIAVVVCFAVGLLSKTANF